MLQAVEFRNADGKVIDLWRGVIVDVQAGKGLRVGNGSVYKIGPNDRIVPVDPALFPADPAHIFRGELIPWRKVSDRLWTSGRRFVIDYVPDPEPRFRLFDNAEFVGQFNNLDEAQAHAEEL